MLSWVEHEKSFITSGPGLDLQLTFLYVTMKRYNSKMDESTSETQGWKC